VLDHRAEAFIPELGRTFACAPGFRVFAAQNPLQEGGGRRARPPRRPRSRPRSVRGPAATRAKIGVVALRLSGHASWLTRTRHRHALSALHSGVHARTNTPGPTGARANPRPGCPAGALHPRVPADVRARMVEFLGALRAAGGGGGPAPRGGAVAGGGGGGGVGAPAPRLSGAGGPWEFNLRDLLRWCELAEGAAAGAGGGCGPAGPNTPMRCHAACSYQRGCSAGPCRWARRMPAGPAAPAATATAGIGSGGPTCAAQGRARRGRGGGGGRGAPRAHALPAAPAHARRPRRAARAVRRGLGRPAGGAGAAGGGAVAAAAGRGASGAAARGALGLPWCAPGQSLVWAGYAQAECHCNW